jgi:hypothetical protein
LLSAVENGGTSFSTRDEETGELREAYADELTDAQLKFFYYARQERERMKKRAAEKRSPNNNF